MTSPSLLPLVMACPPSKRPRGCDVLRRPPAPLLILDPFDEDFTQDDLDEIDIIASQAITTATVGEAGPRAGSTATAAARLDNNSAGSNSSSDANAGLGPGLGSEQDSETPHSQLKRKLAEAEEEVLLKSGEIQVLRDSLRSAQLQNEAHRLRQVQDQNQAQLDQSNRERELSKKVQSLESQLQFKDAEINELRSKHQRGSPLYRNSPKALSSASPSGGFITKESFSAQVKTAPLTPLSANQTPVKTPKSRRQEVTRADPFLSIRGRRATPKAGGVLHSLLLQPQSHRISLVHLLSYSPNSSLACGSGDVIGASGSAVSPVQSLALTGLNMLSLSRDRSSCPGSLLLLPLLNSLLSPLCSDDNNKLPACTSATPAGLPACTGAGAKMEETSQRDLDPEESGVVALRTLTTLLQHSEQVVEAVLSEQSQTRSSGLKNVDCVSQNSLLRCVLRLSRSPYIELACAALTTLQVLVQRSPDSTRLRCVLSELCSSLSSETRLTVVTSTVSVLTALTDHADLTPLLCCHEPCVMVKLLNLVRSRSGAEVDLSEWITLDLWVVRFLSRVFTQSSVRLDKSCFCYSQVVQSVVLILHRLWSDLRSQAPPTAAEAPPTHRGGCVLASLRETVLLFHWLLQNHSNFTENLRGVLHLYDQVLPNLRERLGHSGYSQELALEEICRSEPDEDMETDPVS